MVELKVKLRSSLNRADMSKALERSVKTGGETEFEREKGSETEADVVVFRTGREWHCW